MNDAEENGGLPRGWTHTTIGEVAQVVGGGTPKTTIAGNFNDEVGHAWLTPADLTGYRDKHVSRGRRFLTDQGLAGCAAKYMPAGTILFSSRAPIGYVAIASNPITTNQGFRSFVPSEALHSDFAFHYLKFITPLAEQLASGTTFNELSGSKAKELPLPLPPLAEQRRIATQLDEIDKRRTSSAAHLHSARLILERFRSAVLSAACSGRLTDDLRDDDPDSVTGDVPVTWRQAHLEELVDSIRGGSSEVPTDLTTGYPVLRSSSVRPLSIDYDDVRYLLEAQSSKAANFVEEGDLLVTRLNGNIDYVGNAAVVTGLGDRRVQYPDRLFRIRLNEPSNARYVELFFASPRARTQVEAASRSAAGHQRISISDLKNFAIEIPPPDEQREIVRRVDEMLAIGDRLAAQVGRAASALVHASRASLAKAFRGELVPTEAALAREDGRDYETAEELLTRVNALAVSNMDGTPRTRSRAGAWETATGG